MLLYVIGGRHVYEKNNKKQTKQNKKKRKKKKKKKKKKMLWLLFYLLFNPFNPEFPRRTLSSLNSAMSTDANGGFKLTSKQELQTIAVCEPSHLDLHFLPRYLSWSAGLKGLIILFSNLKGENLCHVLNGKTTVNTLT